MQLDLAGQVDALPLGGKSGLLPLFEAVVNSVQAIDERGNSKGGLIEIILEREGSLLHGSPTDEQFLADIASFTIQDNGCGFTEANYRSFNTAYSTYKRAIGGKGRGRLVWLKVFGYATVESTYVEDGKWWERRFEFRRTPGGIENESATALEAAPGRTTHTTVKLVGFSESYRSHVPKGAKAVARRIVEHCLVMYMLDAMPRVVLRDGGDLHDLSQIYKEDVEKASSKRSFTVGGEMFDIIDVLLRPSAEAQNAIHFCANRREVESIKIADRIPHADGVLNIDDHSVNYAACVTGSFLDRAVNEDRTGFAVNRAGELALADTTVSWNQVENAAVAAAAEYLTPRLQAAKDESVAKIESFIEREEPRYRVLLMHRRTEVERISGSQSDEKIELELHKILAAWRHDVKVEVAQTIKSLPVNEDGFGVYEQRMSGVLEKLTELVKSELAEYVHRRRTVLDFMEKMLGAMESGKFAREDVLHGLFFPVRTTSAHVDYDQHNLWVLDERLSFHKFLASDVAFSQQAGAPVLVDGKDRPDLLIYNHPMAFAENIDDIGSIIIVEFKKPERDEYSGNENPIDQVIGYVEQVLAGKAERIDGSRVTPPRAGTPFYCHVVVSLTPRLRALAIRRDFRVTPDGQGFFQFFQNYNAYIELVDYRKIHSDAVKRNKAFFDKLGLHTGTRRPTPG